MFGAAEHSDYYKTSLYLATNSAATDVYLSGIDFTEQDPANPISTALRVGLVTYAPGQGDTVTGQYIFEVSGERNPQARYNTLDGKDAGEKRAESPGARQQPLDGATVHFDQLTSANFCDYKRRHRHREPQGGPTRIAACRRCQRRQTAALRARVDVVRVGWKAATPTALNNLAATSLQSLALRFPVSVRKGAGMSASDIKDIPSSRRRMVAAAAWMLVLVAA